MVCICTGIFALKKGYCIFEGGGAKGVAHLGVLKAIEEVDDLQIHGYAGTSAGAIMAALAAAGYSSKELLEFENSAPKRSPALDKIGKGSISSLAGLIGPDWKGLSNFRKVTSTARRVDIMGFLKAKWIGLAL